MSEQTDFLEGVPIGPRRGEHVVPSGARLDTCKSCGATIIWIRTANDRAMPLSAATVVMRQGVRWALSHFADCADADEWRAKQ